MCFYLHRYLLRDYMCIGESRDKVATVTHCGRSGQWTYDVTTKLMRHMTTGLCLTVGQHGGAYRGLMMKCDSGNENQHWQFTFYKKAGLKYDQIV